MMMTTLQKYAPRVSKNVLLLLAGLVWSFAGWKILRIGVPDMVSHWTYPVINCLLAGGVFLAFFKGVFYKLVQKHRLRIASYEAEKICAFAFFDKKSYVMMVAMITLGILLRRSGLLAPLYLGTFYTGLGSALEGAGICFMLAFLAKSFGDKMTL